MFLICPLIDQAITLKFRVLSIHFKSDRFLLPSELARSRASSLFRARAWVSFLCCRSSSENHALWMKWDRRGRLAVRS